MDKTTTATRNRRRWVWGLALLGCLQATTPLLGQERLPESVTSSRTLSPGQIDQVEAYVQRWSNSLLEGDDAEVADAREALLQPIRASTSDVFLDRYAVAIRTELPAVLEAQRVSTRLNAMIVASRLGGRDVSPVIIKGLGDPSPAIRYWAAQAVVELAEALDNGATLPGNTVNNVVEALDALIQQEQHNGVLEPALAAAARLDVPAARALFLQTLPSRIQAHASEPSLDYRPLLGSWRSFIQRALQPPVNTDEVRESALHAARFFKLIAQQLDRGEIDAVASASHGDMLRLAQQFLRGAFGLLGGDANANVPTDRQVESALESGDTFTLTRMADRWTQALSAPPIGLSAESLALPSP